MFVKNRSGQFLYFDLTSAISGNPVTGQAAGVSGRVSLDGGAQAAAAGAVAEVGGGQYALGLFAADVNGNNCGYLFTASGCVPRSYTVATVEAASGRFFVGSGSVTAALLSGQAVLVYSGQLSGQQVVAASGVFGTASLNSGQAVLVYSGQLSGQVTTPASGQAYLASGSLFLTTFTSGLLRAALPDYVLTRDFTAHSGHFASGLSGRCLLEASRKLVNAWDLSANSGRLTVYAEDDVTVAYLQDVTSASGAAPITALNTD